MKWNFEQRKRKYKKKEKKRNKKKKWRKGKIQKKVIFREGNTSLMI